MTVHPAGHPPVDTPAQAVGDRFAGLEGYRGLAALAIVVYHVFQYADAGGAPLFTDHRSPGYVALYGLDGFVALFFVLSAFLLSLPYARSALAGDASPSGRAFVVRRAARIVPLYLVAVLVVWTTRNPVLPGDLVDLAEHLTFTQVFDAKRIFFTIGPAWSLAVEVQFYLLLALAGAGAVGACRRIDPRRRFRFLVAATSLVGLLSLGWKLVARYGLHTGATDWPIWFGLPAKLDEFALGILLAVVVARGRLRISGRTALVLRAVSLAVLVVAIATRPQDIGEHVVFHTACALAFALLLASSVLGPQDRWVRLLSGRVLGFLGLVSYSLYIWHEPVLRWLADLGLFPAQDASSVFGVGLLVLIPVSILVAAASYEVIERPAGTLRALVDHRGRPRDYYDGS